MTTPQENPVSATTSVESPVSQAAQTTSDAILGVDVPAPPPIFADAELTHGGPGVDSTPTVSSDGSETATSPAPEPPSPTATADDLTSMRSKAELYDGIKNDSELVEVIRQHYIQKELGETTPPVAEVAPELGVLEQNKQAKQIESLTNMVKHLTVQQQIQEFAAKTSDFEQHRQGMASLAEKAPNMSMQELYDFTRMQAAQNGAQPQQAQAPRPQLVPSESASPPAAVENSFDEMAKQIRAQKGAHASAADLVPLALKEAIRRESEG